VPGFDGEGGAPHCPTPAPALRPGTGAGGDARVLVQHGGGWRWRCRLEPRRGARPAWRRSLAAWAFPVAGAGRAGGGGTRRSGRARHPDSAARWPRWRRPSRRRARRRWRTWRWQGSRARHARSTSRASCSGGQRAASCARRRSRAALAAAATVRGSGGRDRREAAAGDAAHGGGRGRRGRRPARSPAPGVSAARPGTTVSRDGWFAGLVFDPAGRARYTVSQTCARGRPRRRAPHSPAAGRVAKRAIPAEQALRGVHPVFRTGRTTGLTRRSAREVLRGSA
jgi:hypothetical protein